MVLIQVEGSSQGSVAGVGLGWVRLCGPCFACESLSLLCTLFVPVSLFSYLVAVSSKFFLISACDLHLLCLQSSSLT